MLTVPTSTHSLVSLTDIGVSRERSSPRDLRLVFPLHAEGEGSRDLLVRSGSRTGLLLQRLLQFNLRTGKTAASAADDKDSQSSER